MIADGIYSYHVVLNGSAVFKNVHTRYLFLPLLKYKPWCPILIDRKNFARYLCVGAFHFNKTEGFVFTGLPVLQASGVATLFGAWDE